MKNAMSQQKFLIGELRKAASKFGEDVRPHFRNEAHFLDSLERCYQLVANRTCRRWLEIVRDPVFRQYLSGFTVSENHDTATASPAIFRERDKVERKILLALEHTQIHSSEFKKVLPLYNLFGRKRRVPYSKLIEILEKAKIIHVHSSYSAGNIDGCCFCKSYALHTEFMEKVLSEYAGHESQDDEMKIVGDPDGQETSASRRTSTVYDIFCANMPDPDLADKVELARELVKQTQEKCQERNGTLILTLPKVWWKGVSPFGWFHFDPDLTVDGMNMGLRAYVKGVQNVFSGGRYYNWFTTASRALRTHFHWNGQPCREIVDCPSGVFWMLSIVGFMMGLVSKTESERMIRHCFMGTFYTDIAQERHKTPSLKRAFMQMLNDDGKRGYYLSDKPSIHMRIWNGMRRLYPEFCEFVECLRMWYPGEVGKFVHAETTRVERDVIGTTAHDLEKRGIGRLLRVHDALWGFRDDPDARFVLRDVALSCLDIAYVKFGENIKWLPYFLGERRMVG